jgi:AraC-like DNA-binding protein
MRLPMAQAAVRHILFCMIQRNRQVAFHQPPPAPLAPGLLHIAAVDEEIRPGVVIPPRDLECLTIFLTVRGAASTTVAGHTARHAAGAIVAVAGGAHWQESIGDDAWWHVRYLMLSGPWTAPIDAMLHGHASGSAFYPDAPPAWRQRLTSAVHLALRQPEHWQWQVASLITALFADLLMHRSPVAHAGLVEQVARLVDRDPAQAWRIPALARALRMSPSALAHGFRSASGESPAAWVRRRRLRHAMDLLAHGMPVNEVAERLGFCDQFHFSRCYKQVFGSAPSRHARQPASPLHGGDGDAGRAPSLR